MTVGPLGQANRNQQQPQEPEVQGFVMTRSAMSIIIMWIAAAAAGLGAWGAWGWGQGLFTFGVMISVYGILLGIGS